MIDGKPTAVSLFSGLGGMDIGLHQAGIQTLVCVEKNSDAANTLRANSKLHDLKSHEESGFAGNRFPWVVIENDIHKIEDTDILKAAGVGKDEIDLVVGGPPCQTFSRSNEGYRDGTDSSRGSLYLEYARLLHSLEPEGFIFENVRGLTSSNDGEDLEKIKSSLAGKGFDEVVNDDLRAKLQDQASKEYTISVKVLNAANFGVPQTRHRLFIIGTRDDVKPTFPTGREEKDWVNTRIALEDFDADINIEAKGGYENATRSKHGHLLRQIPEGANYQHFSERKYDPVNETYIERSEEELEDVIFEWRSRHWNYLLKLDKDRPSWTLQADPGTTVGPFHWRSRPLSLLEQMRLMDVPIQYYIYGSPRSIQKQIGNAVPPSLAKAVGKQLCLELGYETTDRDLTHFQEVNLSISDWTPWIRVDTETSPWKNAKKIIVGLDLGQSINIRAQQDAIPYAIDAVEIARWHVSDGGSKPIVIANESVTEDTRGRSEVGSILSMTVIPDRDVGVVSQESTHTSDD